MNIENFVGIPLRIKLVNGKIAFSNNLNLGNDDSEILDNIFLIRNDMEERK